MQNQQSLEQRRAATTALRADMAQRRAALERDTRALADEERALAEVEHEAHTQHLAPHASTLLALVPKHTGRGYTCTDERPDADDGDCLRCALLQLQREDKLPYGVWVRVNLELHQKRECG